MRHGAVGKNRQRQVAFRVSPEQRSRMSKVTKSAAVT